MTPHNTNGVGISPWTEITFDKFEGFEVCWAGPHPFKEGFCFGSEDGRLLFTDEASNPLASPRPTSKSGESINGVAFQKDCLVASTRDDITFWLHPSGASSQAAIQIGSHGVAASLNGYFISPIGLNGLLLTKPTPEGPEIVIRSPTPKNIHYFYRSIVLRDSTGGESVLCALRRSGVGVFPFTPPDPKAHFQTTRHPNLDVVDVCALGTGGNSLTAAAVGVDGTLMLFKSVLTDKKPVTMRFSEVKGKVYRVLSCRGHVFLLTSTALYVLANLATRFLWGESLQGVTTPVMVVPMEAVDANLYRDKFLLIVLGENKVLRLDLALLDATIQDDLAHGDVQQFDMEKLDPVWEQHDIEQETQTVGVG